MSQDIPETNELPEQDERQKDEIRKSAFLKEFNDVELELDEDESKVFLKVLSAPNPNAENLRKRSEALFGDMDITADIIPLKIKLKRVK
jgi:hypothetical protein